MHYWLTDTKLTIIFFFLTKNAPSDEWDSSKYFVQQRGKCKYGYGEYSVYEYRRHLIVAFQYRSDRYNCQVMNDVDAVAGFCHIAGESSRAVEAGA